MTVLYLSHLLIVCASPLLLCVQLTCSAFTLSTEADIMLSVLTTLALLIVLSTTLSSIEPDIMSLASTTLVKVLSLSTTVSSATVGLPLFDDISAVTMSLSLLCILVVVATLISPSITSLVLNGIEGALLLSDFLRKMYPQGHIFLLICTALFPQLGQSL